MSLCLEKCSQKHETKKNNARERCETPGKQVHGITDVKNWHLSSFDSKEVMDTLKGSTEYSFSKLDKSIYLVPDTHVAEAKIT